MKQITCPSTPLVPKSVFVFPHRAALLLVHPMPSPVGSAAEPKPGWLRLLSPGGSPGDSRLGLYGSPVSAMPEAPSMAQFRVTGHDSLSRWQK